MSDTIREATEGREVSDFLRGCIERTHAPHPLYSDQAETIYKAAYAERVAAHKNEDRP